MYSPDTKDVAKPSELLNSIKAVMSVLQSIENYGHYFQHFSIYLNYYLYGLCTGFSGFYKIIMKFIKL